MTARPSQLNPSGKCLCGCGGDAPISKVTRFKSGQRKGHPLRYISGHHQRCLPESTREKMSLSQKARFNDRPSSEHPKWNGGEILVGGYVYVKNKNHPRATKDGYVLRTVLVVEKHTGKIVPKGMVIHHINRISTDDRIENLQVVSVHQHVQIHGILKKVNESRRGKRRAW